jgi:hypothetical protein
MRTFASTPVAVVVSTDEGDVTWLGQQARYGPDPGGEAPQVIEILTTGGTIKHVGLGTVSRDSGDEVNAVSWPNEFPVQIREAMPSDAVGSPSISSTLPLPLEVISTMVSDDLDYYGSGKTVSLHALTNDDGFVSTMLLMAPTGLYARYDRAWIRVEDPDVVDGRTVVDVRDEALVTYDDYDQVDQSVHVAMLPLVEGESVDSITPPPEPETPEPTGADAADPLPVTETEEPPAAPVTAAAVAVASVDDLLVAITAAAEDPDMRWYVEKRAKALGYEEPLPW